MRLGSSLFIALACMAMSMLATPKAALAGGGCSSCGGSELAKRVNLSINQILMSLLEKSKDTKEGPAVHLDLGPLFEDSERYHDVHPRVLNRALDFGAVIVDGKLIRIENPQVTQGSEITEYKGDPSKHAIEVTVSGLIDKNVESLIEDFSHEICRMSPQECKFENRYLDSGAIARLVKDDPTLRQLIQDVREEAVRFKNIVETPCETPDPMQKDFKPITTNLVDATRAAAAVQEQPPKLIVADRIRFSRKRDLGNGRFEYRGLYAEQGGTTRSLAVTGSNSLCEALAAQEGNQATTMESYRNSNSTWYPRQPYYDIVIRDKDNKTRIAYAEEVLNKLPYTSVICH